VDMLEAKDGPMVMEVNSSPGLEGIENATGVDIAGEIIALIEDEVLFPDIDIRQRLTLQSGYGVIELPVDERSELCGKTIRSSGLRERDVLVLTIQRGSITIPNPRTDREIRPGDVLLCFGKALTLRGLSPPPRATRKRKKKKVGPPPAAPASEIPPDA
jgi:ribosomal protein S6--L-glutamate ligase